MLERVPIALAQVKVGVVVIITAQLHSTKPELRFCTGSNPACCVSEIHDMVQAGNKAKHLLLVNHTTKTIHHHHLHYQVMHLKTY